MIFITDGNDTNGADFPNIENAAEASGSEIFAIGVGEEVDWDTLYAIAYDPDPSNQDPLDPDYPDAGHVFHTDDYAGLLNIIDALAEVVLEAAATSGVYVIESVSSSGDNIRALVKVWPDGAQEILSYEVY